MSYAFTVDPNETKSIKSIVVAGQGYVGLPLAMLAVKCGYKVAGIDTAVDRVNMISVGNSPVTDVSSEELGSALKTERYRISDNYTNAGGFDIAVITVPTPLRDGKPVLSFIEESARSLAGNLTPGSTVILESTTYPGTTEEVLAPILEGASGLQAGIDFFVGYSPERLDPGNTSWNLANTPKVVSGINPESLAAVTGFYSSLGIRTVPVSGTREAEMTKLLENTFRHVNIALINELAVFSERLEVNLWEAIEAAETKPFGFMKFTPGPGVGGHCLPIDPSYLSWAVTNKTGARFRFVELANEINAFMPEYVLSRASEIIGKSGKPLGQSSVLIVGLSYKANTGDTRESPGLALGKLLEDCGVEVWATDGFVADSEWPQSILRTNPDDTREYDLAIILTAHSGEDYGWVLSSSTTVLDTRNVLSGANVKLL